MRSFFTSSLVLSLASAAALPAGQQYPDKHPQKHGNKHNHTRLNVQVGDRPYFLVDNMDEVLKVALAEPLTRIAPATSPDAAAVQPAISDDTITH